MSKPTSPIVNLHMRDLPMKVSCAEWCLIFDVLWAAASEIRLLGSPVLLLGVIDGCLLATHNVDRDCSKP